MIEKEDIESLFSKQLAYIKDNFLREKVIQVWLDACNIGGWKDISELTNIPFTLLKDAAGINIIDHTIAVTEGARSLAIAQINTYKKLPYKIDLDRLVAGGLLHDVGKLVEIQHINGTFSVSRSGLCLRHPISGAILAAKVGLPEEVVNIIACHSREGEGSPQTVETILITKADFAAFDPIAMLASKKLIVGG